VKGTRIKMKNKVRKDVKGQPRALDTYYRAAQTGARKLPDLSPDGQLNPMPPLSGATDISDAELAALAWQINPDLCKTNLVDAIKLTMQTLMDVREARRKALADLVAEDLMPAIEREKNERQRFLDNFRTRGKEDYERVVKCITGEKNWDRALPKIKRWETAKGATTEKALRSVLVYYMDNIFTGTELMRLSGEFRQWWAQEKSKLAKESAQTKKGGQGQVKRKASDLRFTENRRHKKGYCRACGQRVQASERLCDDCLSGKPILYYWGDTLYLREAPENLTENIVGRY
jgi:hypothetical protein